MSRNGFQNFILFVLLAVGVTAAWYYIDRTFFPPPPPKEPTPPPPPPPPVLYPDEHDALGAGTGGFGALASRKAVPAGVLRAAAAGGYAAGPQLQKAVTPPKPTEPQTLVRLGTDKSYLRVMLNTKGGGVQQVILPRFDEANRLGTRAKNEAGETVPLHLIPGVVRKREPSMLSQPPFPELKPGAVADPSILTEPSYLLTHYPPDDGKTPEQYPVDELAVRTWEVDPARTSDTPELSQVTFHTTLGAPYFLKVVKTYTLKPGEYHLGFHLSFEALPGRVAGKDAVKFRYQLSGATGLPIESEWSTSSYRNALIGWTGPSGTPRRTIEDALTVHAQHGGTQVKAEGNTFAYAATANQFFASALAIDDTQDEAVRKGLWQYARATREPLPWAAGEKDPFAHGIEDKQFLGDITVRVAASPIDPQPGKPVAHGYLIYNGPFKARLLHQLKDADGNPAVAPELVDRYLDKLTLRTLTDHHSPHFFGRLSNSLWIADLIIFFTNVMHSVLGWLHGLVPVWGLNILMLTVLVRLLLMGPSKKQQGMMARMQEKMARLQPEIDKLKVKYAGDYHTFNREKTQLLLRNGVNPLSSLGGCLLMFAQFPVFMGLYFCLQESIFFRLEPFLWMPNLAAPDMVLWWGEGIPYLSEPTALGGTIYLGPYLNILPLAAVGLMFVQQQLTMPPPMDEQQAMNAKIMKFMMLFMGLFFYKMAAGMCLYFIVSTGWALVERRFVKKNIDAAKADVTLGTDRGDASAPVPPRPNSGAKVDAPPAPAPATGGFFSRLKARIEEVQRQAEQQRQIRNDQSQPPAAGQQQQPKKGGPPGGGGGSGGGGKGKKKKRK